MADVAEFGPFASAWGGGQQQQQAAGYRLIKEEVLDRNCGLFRPQYDVIDYSAF